jgi:hypothetical protein
MLRFEQTSAGREARGLSDRSSKTFHTVYAGEVEFGHYFQVHAPSGEFWRWSVRFPITPETIGEAGTEAEARAIFVRCYDIMLARIGLQECRQVAA